MNIVRTFKRDLGSQFAVSRNLKEGLLLKARRVFWAILYALKGIKCGLKAMRSEQLGSSVIYRGRKCFVSNWSGSAKPTLASDGFYEEYCDRSEIKNVRNLREYWHRFCFGVDFYMGSWHGIDVNRKLYNY